MKQQNPNFAFSTVLVQKWTERPSLPESLEVKMVKEELGREDCADSQCLGLQIIGQLFKATSTNSFEDFKRQFVFGVEMRMWRKGRVKDVVAFTDQNIPNLLWIATRSKAFLFDLCYCSLASTDVELQLSEHVTHYFVLSYFEEKIPFLFQDLPTLKRFITLFRSAIFQYQQLNPVYPPYLSKLTKHYTVVETVDSGKRASSPAEILKIAERLVGPDKRTIYEDILRQVVGEQRESSGNGLEDAALEVEEVMRFFKIACCNENLKAIYQYYAQSALSRKADYILPLMSVQNLKLFLKREQGESEQAASSIAAKHFSGAVSFYEFCTFLSSKQLNYLALAPPLDEHLPLNHYFCYSSHNTYLSGNQLTSDSKVERYLQDLANGLKCLEIDVHESGQELIVTHALNGLHLNKEVSFEEVIREIGSYCSRTADFYPIILSIENRTSKKSSYRLAAIFEKYLGPFLLTLHHQFKHEITTVCHTLAQLKNKVIIKADARMKDILAFSKKEQHSPKKEQQLLPLTIPLRPQPSYLSKQFTLKYQRFQGHVSLFQARRKAFQSEFMASYYQPLDEIAKVTALFKSEQGINNHNSVGYESTSITSKKLEKLQAKVAVEYTRRSFLRVYPAGTEIGSSNFSPIPGLQRGAQLIALNTQTKDDFAWLMMSYFCAGTRDSQERMGYIPKPLHLINDQPQKTTTKNISISILSTLFPTKIRFFGSEEDMNQNKDNSLSFEVKDVQVGFFMFQMENGLRDCIPLRFIREGYRVIVGRNKDYVDCGVPVLLRVKIKNVSSEILSLRLH